MRPVQHTCLKTSHLKSGLPLIVALFPGTNHTKCREYALTAFGNINGYYDEGKYILTPFSTFSAMPRLYERKCVQYISYLLPICAVAPKLRPVLPNPIYCIGKIGSMP